MNPSEKIEKQAEKILRKYGIDRPPVPVEKIAKLLGLSIRREPFGGELSGALYRKDDVGIIGVNKNENRKRQRFTIAHELGHYLLHDEEIYIDRRLEFENRQVESKGQGRTYSRDSSSRLGIDPREIEANRFAASLLMPAKLLRSDLREMGIGIPLRSISDIKPLADRYQVSFEAMLLRLINLGVKMAFYH